MAGCLSQRAAMGFASVSSFKNSVNIIKTSGEVCGEKHVKVRGITVQYVPNTSSDLTCNTHSKYVCVRKVIWNTN
jgi:hypothetical protein